jgi:hypothetical protein
MSSHQLKKTISLTELTPEDYQLWAVQLEATFTVHKVWDIVNGNEPKPLPIPENGEDISTDENTPDVDLTQYSAPTRKKLADWQDCHALALQALLTCLDRSTLTRVAHLKSASAIWLALSREFGPVSDIKRGEAQTAFHSILKDPSTSITDHINRYVQLQQQVDYHRPPGERLVSPAEVNLNFIRSLGPDWRTFHQSISNEIRAMPRSALLARVRIFSQNSPENALPVPMANLTTFDQKPQWDTFDQKRKQQTIRRHNNAPFRSRNRFNRPKSSQFSFDRPFSRRFIRPQFCQRNQFNSSRPNIPTFSNSCYYCKNPGHTITQCFKKQWADQQWKRQPEQPIRFPNQQWTANVTILDPVQPSVRQFTIPPSFVWVLDSAANTHVQPYDERFTRYTPFSTPQTVTGVGRTVVTALGIGSVLLTDNDQHHFTVHEVLYVPSARLPILSMIKLQRQGLSTRPLLDGFLLSTTNNSFRLLGQTYDDII